MRQIPCSNCQFFVDSRYLKCPVHPKIALSEAAIGCDDYHPS
jgi:RNA polymerase subunit RPABC4/transcription elongation factor Spt4